MADWLTAVLVGVVAGACVAAYNGWHGTAAGAAMVVGGLIGHAAKG